MEYEISPPYSEEMYGRFYRMLEPPVNRETAIYDCNREYSTMATVFTQLEWEAIQEKRECIITDGKSVLFCRRLRMIYLTFT